MPRRLFQVFLFEFLKAIRAKVTWVTILLPVMLAVASVWIDQVSRQVSSIASGEEAVVPSAYLSFARGAGNGFILGGILLLLYSSMIVSNEGSWKTFKTIMLRPKRRSDWIIGKYKLLATLALFMVISVSGAAWLAGAMTGEYGDIAEEGYVIYEAKDMMRWSLTALALVIPPMLALIAFGLMFSTMTDHTGIAASSALGAYIILETAKDSMPENRIYLFNTFMPSLMDTSYFQALRGFADGMSDTGWEEHIIYYNVGTPIVAAVVFFVVALVIFQRRNFLV